MCISVKLYKSFVNHTLIKHCSLTRVYIIVTIWLFLSDQSGSQDGSLLSSRLKEQIVLNYYLEYARLGSMTVSTTIRRWSKTKLLYDKPKNNT